MTKRVYHIWCIFESNVHCYELMKHRFHSLIIHSEPYRAWPIRQVSMLIYWSWCIILLQLLLWNCLDCMIHHKWNVREEQKYICVAWTSNNRVIAACDLYCCLLPRCEALCTCHSGFPIATVLYQRQHNHMFYITVCVKNKLFVQLVIDWFVFINLHIGSH